MTLNSKIRYYHWLIFHQQKKNIQHVNCGLFSLHEYLVTPNCNLGAKIHKKI